MMEYVMLQGEGLPNVIWKLVYKPMNTTGWGPPAISWFINHEIIPINYSYI